MTEEYVHIFNEILGSINSSARFYPLAVRKKIADEAIAILEEYDRTRVFTLSNPRMTD